MLEFSYVYTKSEKSQGTHHYHVVESYRVGKKVRQRTLLSLGREEQGNLEAIVQSASRHLDILTASQLAKEFSIEKTFILGPLLILDKLFEQLGINATIKQIASVHKRLSFDLRKIFHFSIASRY